jgi:hypothetical protein
MRSVCFWFSLIAIFAVLASNDAKAADPQLATDILPLLKTRCVKCHGPARQEGKLNLSIRAGLARGGESGELLVARDPAGSLLWQRIEADEMPPEDPLPANEKAAIKEWIANGAAGLPTLKSGERPASDHWAFDRLRMPAPPPVADANAALSPVDRFLSAQLEAHGLTPNGEADRAALIRRVSFDLTGLPPTPEEIDVFDRDSSANAYENMIERYLASPHYGERWGKFWLDAAGYADSNGYFNADTDRPLAYRYRDYVVRSFNDDKPFDRFVVEQLAGDELSGFVPGQEATPEIVSLLEATHFLRNGQDGSGESDGNAEEVRVDRYFALESTTQIVASSLLGLTVQCAKCHDHKFEPISQRDYYRLQSVFYPAFDIRNWLKPNERFVYAHLPGELARWEALDRQTTEAISALKSEFATWMRDHPLPSRTLFRDEFEPGGPPLAEAWSNAAPGDDTPAGESPVQLDALQAPAAARQDGVLRIVESGAAGDRWLSTRQSFDWTPEAEGQWVQATFDLVDDKSADGSPAARIAYLIALHDFDDNGPLPGGNVLIDGNPSGGAAVHVDYPGSDAKTVGDLGAGKYRSGHNYGVRITNQGKNRFLVEHLVDRVAEEKTVTLSAEDLPAGGFGFEYCCGRSFAVDNVVIERSDDEQPQDEQKAQLEAIRTRQQQLRDAVAAKEKARGEKPGKIAWVTDRDARPADVFLLERGNYGSPGEKVEPAPLAALDDANTPLAVEAPWPGAKSSGRRLAWARWLTQANSRPAALLARVQVNRIWQHHFGSGIVSSTENLGASGAPPSHEELLEYLATEFIRSGWSTKHMHRLLLGSAAYRRTGALNDKAFGVDPDNRLLWRHSLRRLDAESLRDAMLAVSGRLDCRFGGPYVPTTRDEFGEVLILPDTPGALRRSIYLQQRRTQTVSLLGVFDSPTIVFNCIERPASTMPLQSLSLLNANFVVSEAGHFAARLASEAGDNAEARVTRAFLLALGRPADSSQMAASLEFFETQRGHYAGAADADTRAWADFCQMLLASNAFLYVE